MAVASQLILQSCAGDIAGRRRIALIMRSATCEPHVRVGRSRRWLCSRLCAATGVGEAAPPPLRVVITGATKGLGRALASQFVARGDQVLISSRDAARVQAAVQELRGVRADTTREHVHGLVCDVSRAGDVDVLAETAVTALGGCDLWVNNAGSNAYRYAPLRDTTPAAVAEIVSTNLTGTLLCCRAAMRLMVDQPGGGHVFLMLGAGSDGLPTEQFAAYGATKSALPQLAKSLQAELGDAPVGVHCISPGLVWTELVQAGKDTFGSRGRFFINALCEPADDVAMAMVPLILQVARGSSRGSQTLRVLTPPLAAQRLLLRLLTGKNKGRYYPED